MRTSTKALALLAAGAMLCGAAAGPATAETSTPPAPQFGLNGTGGVTLDWPGWQGDKARFIVHASGVPGSTRGTFHVTHWRADGKLFADFDGTMDCLAVGGPVAVATGIIKHVKTEPPGLTITPGRRVGFTVLDQGGHDRLGWSWAVAGFGNDVLPCTGTAPIVKVNSGGYKVHG